MQSLGRKQTNKRMNSHSQHARHVGTDGETGHTNMMASPPCSILSTEPHRCRKALITAATARREAAHTRCSCEQEPLAAFKHGSSSPGSGRSRRCPLPTDGVQHPTAPHPRSAAAFFSAFRSVCLSDEKRPVCAKQACNERRAAHRLTTAARLSHCRRGGTSNAAGTSQTAAPCDALNQHAGVAGALLQQRPSLGLGAGAR